MLKPRPRVLVADDDDSLLRLIRNSLPESRYEVYTASDGDTAWDIIRNLVPDIVLLDIMMPCMDGLTICKALREDRVTRHIPVILLTAKTHLEDRLKGFEHGADDYITKPFSPVELRARIETHLRRYLRESGMSPVTQLPGNREIEKELSSRLGDGRKFAVCYIDLDDFKAYNDHYGFSAGSAVLKMTGDLLVEVLDERGEAGDFVGHVGGDDFVVLTSIEMAEPICSTIIRNFDERIRLHYEEEDLENGYIPARDRSGHYSNFGVMTISISVVHNESRTLTDPEQIGRIAAELKRYAKELEGSVCVVDRRKV